MAEDVNAAYLPPCPACAGDANWCECCPCCQQESGDCACDEIACGWDHLGRLRAENAALLAFLQMEYGMSEADALLNASAAVAALNAPYSPDGDA